MKKLTAMVGPDFYYGSSQQTAGKTSSRRLAVQLTANQALITCFGEFAPGTLPGGSVQISDSALSSTLGENCTTNVVESG